MRDQLVKNKVLKIITKDTVSSFLDAEKANILMI